MVSIYGVSELVRFTVHGCSFARYNHLLFILQVGPLLRMIVDGRYWHQHHGPALINLVLWMDYHINFIAPLFVYSHVLCKCATLVCSASGCVSVHYCRLPWQSQNPLSQIKIVPLDCFPISTEPLARKIMLCSHETGRHNVLWLEVTKGVNLLDHLQSTSLRFWKGNVLS